MAKPGWCHHLDSDSPYAKTGDGGGLGSRSSAKFSTLNLVVGTTKGTWVPGTSPKQDSGDGGRSYLVKIVSTSVYRYWY